MAGFQIQMKQVGTNNDNIIVHNLYPTNRDIDISIDDQIINDYKLNTSLTSSTVNGVLRYIWNKFSSYYLKDETVTTGAYSDYTNTAHAIDPGYTATILTERTAVADTADKVTGYANMYENENCIVATGKKVSDLLPVSSLETSVTNLRNRSESLDSDTRILSTYLAHVINEDLQSHLSTYASTSDTSLKSYKSDNSDVATYDIWGRHIDTTYLSIDGTNYNNTAASYSKKALSAGITSSSSKYSIDKSVSDTVLDVLGRKLTGSVKHVLSGKLYMPTRNSDNTNKKIILGTIPYYGAPGNYLFFIENVGVLFMPVSKPTSMMFMTRYKIDNSLLTIVRDINTNTMTFTAVYSSALSFKARFAYAGTNHEDDEYAIRYKVPKGTETKTVQGTWIKPTDFITRQKLGSGGYLYKKYTIPNESDIYVHTYIYLDGTTEKSFYYFEPDPSANIVCEKSSTTDNMGYEDSTKYTQHGSGYPINIGLQFAIFEM